MYTVWAKGTRLIILLWYWKLPPISASSCNLRSSVSSTESDINKRLAKAWSAIVICYRSYGSQTYPIKRKRIFFQAAVMSILLHRCTTWTLSKRMKKKLDVNCTRVLRSIFNKSWKQHPTKQQLYGHLPPISKIRRTRHAGHCWRSKDELISNVLQWTPSHGRTGVRRPARTYLQQVRADTGRSLEDLPSAMDDKDEWWERIKEICTLSMTWWWWWWLYTWFSCLIIYQLGYSCKRIILVLFN